MSDRVPVPGVLLVFEDPLVQDAATVREHVGAFGRYSKFQGYPLNVTFGLPPALTQFRFSACVFHYSIRPTYAWIDTPLGDYLASCAQHKVAIFQDEIWHFAERERFLTRFGINTLYSRHKPQHVRQIYGPHLPMTRYVHYLAGYVSDDLIDRAGKRARSYAERPIDVGYRGRRLPFYFGRGGQEKAEIAEKFAELAAGRGLRLDVASRETDRLYGHHWDQFLADCKATLGVEGGVSVVDPTGRFRAAFEELVRERPNLTYGEYAEAMGPDFEAHEDRIDYRSLTPRHFESAAFRNLQILYEGRYDGILEPWVHYVPLRKDFANLDEVLAVLADPGRAAAIADRAYNDLIASGRYSYANFVESFDAELTSAGLAADAQVPASLHRRVTHALGDWARFQSRVKDFERVGRKLPAGDRPIHPAVEAAQFLLIDYQKRVGPRRGSSPGFGAWLRQAEDRYFWKLLEGRLGERVPARPEFDPRPRRLSPLEWLATVPAWWGRKAVRRARRWLG